MELEKLLNSTVWGFQTSAFYTHAAWQCLMREPTASSATCGPRGCAQGTGPCGGNIFTAHAVMWRSCSMRSGAGSPGGLRSWQPWRLPWRGCTSILTSCTSPIARSCPNMSFSPSRRSEAAAWESWRSLSRKESGAAGGGHGALVPHRIKSEGDGDCPLGMPPGALRVGARGLCLPNKHQ